jgi:hypothetical protein
MGPARIALRSGSVHEPDGALRLSFFRQEFLVLPPDYEVRQVGTDQAPSSFTQALLLTYMVTADGAVPSDRWTAFRDLPGGMFYAQAFRGYAENRLVRELGKEGLEAFLRGAQRLGGGAIEVGGNGYAFQVLPRIQLAAVYWPGDEDLTAQASILFEDTATHYMPTDGLAILGSHLTGAIIKAARG